MSYNSIFPSDNLFRLSEGIVSVCSADENIFGENISGPIIHGTRFGDFVLLFEINSDGYPLWLAYEENEPAENPSGEDDDEGNPHDFGKIYGLLHRDEFKERILALSDNYGYDPKDICIKADFDELSDHMKDVCALIDEARNLLKDVFKSPRDIGFAFKVFFDEKYKPCEVRNSVQYYLDRYPLRFISKMNPSEILLNIFSDRDNFSDPRWKWHNRKIYITEFIVRRSGMTNVRPFFDWSLIAVLANLGFEIKDLSFRIYRQGNFTIDTREAFFKYLRASEIEDLQYELNNQKFKKEQCFKNKAKLEQEISSIELKMEELNVQLQQKLES